MKDIGHFRATYGLAVVAVLASASAVSAQQDTTRLRQTRPDQRITISKGEVGTPIRVDTLYITRYDTVRITEVRVDTVTTTLAAPATLARLKGPMYWGAYAGATAPERKIDRVYTKGFHAGGVLGWEPRNGLLGFRLDGAVSQVGKEQGAWNAVNQGDDTSLMMHLAGDVKANVLALGGWGLYGIGGLNYNRYKRIALAASSNDNCNFNVGDDCFENANNERWSDKFGFNLGAGVDFHIGSQDMFLEARYMAIQANSARSWFLPISLGVRYF